MTPQRRLELIVHAKVSEDEGLRDAVAALRQEGHVLEINVTRAPGDAEQCATRAAQRADTVVAAGGDGTLNEVVNGLWRAGTPVRAALGVVPMGTANDFAVCCGLADRDPLAALRLILGTEPTPIDLGRMDDRVFLNVASGGFGAEVTAATPPGAKDLLGRVAYLLTDPGAGG